MSNSKGIVNAYKANLQPNTYYLFLVTNPKSSTLAGFMPRSKECGFIFLSSNSQFPIPEPQLVRTIAHELGHGAFSLKHTFVDEKYTMQQGGTDNLMDYASGTALYKYQWDRLRSSEIVWGLFEGDDAGAIFECQPFWFNAQTSAKPGDCETVGGVIDKIKEAINSAKKLLVSTPADNGKLVGNNIKVGNTNYKSIQIQYFGNSDKHLSFDPTLYEVYNPTLPSIDVMPSILFKDNGKLVFKILVDAAPSDRIKKRDELKTYLFETDNSYYGDVVDNPEIAPVGFGKDKGY
jgi:hypothetical protein